MTERATVRNDPRRAWQSGYWTGVGVSVFIVVFIVVVDAIAKNA